MKNSSSLPPIASPHGEGEVPSPFLDRDVAHLEVRLHWWAAFRYSVWESLTPFYLAVLFGAPLVVMGVLLGASVGKLGVPLSLLIYLSFFVIIFLTITFFNVLMRLFSRRRFAIQISPVEVRVCYPGIISRFPWKYIVWIIEWRGDVWLASFLNGCFIPREAFASRDDARKFVAHLRELKRSKGQSWRDEWGGHNFGLSHEEI